MHEAHKSYDETMYPLISKNIKKFLLLRYQSHLSMKVNKGLVSRYVKGIIERNRGQKLCELRMKDYERNLKSYWNGMAYRKDSYLCIFYTKKKRDYSIKIYVKKLYLTRFRYLSVVLIL